MDKAKDKVKQLVNCRVGSLEIIDKVSPFVYDVNCRVGSLEIKALK